MFQLWAEFTSWSLLQEGLYLSCYPNELKLRPFLLSIFNENYSSFQTHVFPALVSFFILSDNFFDFGPIFKCHTQRMEKVNWISRSRTLCWIFWKKIIKKIEYSRSLSDPENYWCGHQQSYNFFPISRHFLITQENENQLIRSRKISCNWENVFFLIISKGKIFIADRKKSLYR